ncbi:hypothetical protein AB0E99_22810 [Streptomyces sp. NPDC030592]|uniref:hypothetical protein n=1 Tax=Streptomyces sp. NPDC030592 TaxID=3155365 RepID=UPI0033DC8B95
MSAAPSCCGRPMRASGSQFVCGKCGAWVDPGTGPRPLLAVAAEPDPEHGRAPDPLPIRPPRPHPRQPSARAA